MFLEFKMLIISGISKLKNKIIKNKKKYILIIYKKTKLTIIINNKTNISKISSMNNITRNNIKNNNNKNNNISNK